MSLEAQLDEELARLIPKYGLTLTLASLIRFVEKHIGRMARLMPEHLDHVYLHELLANLRHTYQTYCKRYD